MKINDRILQSENVYLMISDGEELSIMNELDKIIVNGKAQSGHIWISTLEQDADEIDEIVLNKFQAKFLKTVLDQIL